ncbi:Uncharacterised protein [Mycobacteroides abscessus subsp. abscessus]|nr:Uncharacterised protein [Mycobacteroides abscessus subsp. abscessus]
MVLTVLAQVSAIGIDDGGGVVEDARLFLLVHGQHQDHAVLPGQLGESLGNRAGHGFGVAVVLLVLDDAEIRAVEQLLKADHLGTPGRSLGDKTLVFGEHRFLVAGPSRLRQCGSDHRH